MHEYEITRSSLLPLHPFAQHVPQRMPSDQLSKTSISSCGTVLLSPHRKLSQSTSSPQSTSSTQLRVRNENVPLPRDASPSSLPTTPTPVGGSSRKRSRREALRISSWDDEPKFVSRPHGAPSLLSDIGRLSDIDLGNLHQNQIEKPIQDPKVSFDMKIDKSVRTLRFPSEGSQETAAPRTFNVTANHPFKHDRPFKRWVGKLRQNPPGRTRSLTVREARWDLEDFDDKEHVKPDNLQRRRRNGHQKSSSWSAFGFGATQEKTNDPSLSRARSQSHKPTRTRFLRKNRSSMASDSTNDGSTNDWPSSAPVDDKIAWERATHRRRILDELLSSEESYVADLKVLLHVSNLNDEIQDHSTADWVYLGLCLHSRLCAEDCSGRTARDFAECRGNPAST